MRRKHEENVRFFIEKRRNMCYTGSEFLTEVGFSLRIVVKVGTSTLAHAGGRLNIRCVETLCKVLSDLKNDGNEVILVSSGAIGMGVGKLNLRERPICRQSSRLPPWGSAN